MGRSADASSANDSNAEAIAVVGCLKYLYQSL